MKIDYIRHPSICVCECDNRCDIGKYLNVNVCTSIKLVADNLVTAFEDKMLNTTINTNATQAEYFRYPIVSPNIYLLILMLIINNR